MAVVTSGEGWDWGKGVRKEAFDFVFHLKQFICLIFFLHCQCISMNINRISKMKDFQLKKEKLLFSHCKDGNMGGGHSPFSSVPGQADIFITSSPTAVLCSPLAFCQHLSCRGDTEACDLGGPLFGRVVVVCLMLTLPVHHTRR